MSNVINLKDNDRILISRTDRLGDLVLSLPFIETLKIRYPNCRIDVITSLYASPILDNNKRICKILRVQNNLLLTNNLYKKDLLQKIKKENYKIVIVLYPERKISRLFYQAEIPTRIGTAGRFHSIFYNTHIYHSRKKNIKHEYNYNLDFLKFFQPGETIETPSVYIRKKEIIHAQKILKNACIKKEFIVLHPGTGGSSECWPMEHFIKLYKMLEDRGVELVISGSDKEGEDVEILSKKLGIPVKKITGETDLRTLAAVLSLASLVVANSTGPLHLAVAVGTKVVGLYPSKKAMSPVRWGPLGEKDVVIQPVGFECRCRPKQCKCMEKVTPKHVFNEVVKLMEKNKNKVIV